MGIKVIATNKKAYHEYEIMEKFEAGIMLQGTEVKSLREGRVNLGQGWVSFIKDEAFLLDVNISHYSHGNINNHLERRTRKLLLNRKELIRLESAAEERGWSVIPTKIYLKGQLVKIEIALARGKKLHDKRESAKTRDANREIERTMRNRG